MNRKSHMLFYVFVGLTILLVGELVYLQQTKEMTQEQQLKKRNFVTIAGLPDLAIVTETSYIRHRTMSDLFSIYRDDASLREYFPSTFVYSYSGIINDK
ncbi:hypothetical protein MNB_SV-12-1350 [hydrothermal vent metagenome]|uniref:Uncharacterized protein n=1 Tax=hydrothermal vent metagenome TaxID=652676 RepID=A0A1W1BHD2_9ZZZZ